MKNVNTLLIWAVLVFTISSCAKKDNEKCGADAATGFPTITPTTYKTLNMSGININGGRDSAIYFTKSGYSTFAFGTDVENNVCPYEDMLVTHVLVLKHPDPNLKDTLVALEFGLLGRSFKEQVPQTSAIQYYASEPFTFRYTAETGFSIASVIYFPSQGSWSADSAYFFGNLEAFSLSAKYNLIP